MAVFSKILTKTDIKKRLSVPTKKKTCFLDFKGQRKVDFEAVDENGEVWTFVCFRREGDYPKPVLSDGWLPFVRWWKLAIGDKVEVSKDKGQYRIKVIKRATLQTRALSPPVQNQEPERTMKVAGYVEEEPTLVSHSTDQVITNDNDQTEGLGKFNFISMTPGSQVRQPKLINFFELESGSQP